MMFDLAAEHAGYVMAAYGISLLVLIALVAVTLLKARALSDDEDA